MRRETIVGACALLSFLVTQADGELTCEDVISGIQSRKDLLSSVRIRCRQEVYSDRGEGEQTYRGRPCVFVRNIAVKRQNDRFHVERTTLADGKNPEALDVYAWDGIRYARYTSALNETHPRTGGRLAANPGPGTALYWGTATETEVFDIRKPLWEVVTEGEWRLVGVEPVGRYRAHKLIGSGFVGGSADVQLWVDSTRDFAPVQLVVTIKLADAQAIVETLNDVRLEQRGGTWVISEASYTVNNPKTERIGEYRFVVEEYDVGVDFEDEDFKVVFPEGATVWDETTKMWHVIGKGVVLPQEGAKGYIRTAPSDLYALNSGELSGEGVSEGRSDVMRPAQEHMQTPHPGGVVRTPNEVGSIVREPESSSVLTLRNALIAAGAVTLLVLWLAVWSRKSVTREQ